MTSDGAQSGERTVEIAVGTPVGECAECGMVHGEDVDFNFPHPAECSCGRELERATIADKRVEVTQT